MYLWNPNVPGCIEVQTVIKRCHLRELIKLSIHVEYFMIQMLFARLRVFSANRDLQTNQKKTAPDYHSRDMNIIIMFLYRYEN